MCIQAPVDELDAMLQEDPMELGLPVLQHAHSAPPGSPGPPLPDMPLPRQQVPNLIARVSRCLKLHTSLQLPCRNATLAKNAGVS